MGQLKIVCAQLGPIDTNTYIFMDDEIKEAIIIDPAGSPEELIKFLEDEGYSLDGVLLTHGHHDHIGGADSFNKIYMNHKDLKVFKEFGTMESRLNYTHEFEERMGIKFADSMLPMTKKHYFQLKIIKFLIWEIFTLK